MEYKLVIKDYNGLRAIYLTKFCKVLVRVVGGVIIILNFYIYKSYSVLLALFLRSFTPLY